MSAQASDQHPFHLSVTRETTENIKKLFKAAGPQLLEMQIAGARYVPSIGFVQLPPVCSPMIAMVTVAPAYSGQRADFANIPLFCVHLMQIADILIRAGTSVRGIGSVLSWFVMRTAEDAAASRACPIQQPLNEQ